MEERDWTPEDIELREQLAEHQEQARLLGNELARRGHWPAFPRCPRCGRVVREIDFGSHSRITTERDVMVCNLCGKLEALRDSVAWPPIPPDQWPVDARELGVEFGALCQRDRSSVFQWMPVERLSAGDEEEPD